MGNSDWETPPEFFERVSRAYGPFGLDAAASKANKKCRFAMGPGNFSRECCSPHTQDALRGFSWFHEFYVHGLRLSEHVWLNPPYTNLMSWVTKATEESDCGLTIVMLLPWGQWAEWMELAVKRAEIVRVVGRIRFIDPEAKGRTSPNGMNILAIFRPPIEGVTWPVGFTGAAIRA